jgi:hypothetical protein
MAFCRSSRAGFRQSWAYAESERVFFPLLEELLKPQVFRRDPDGMGETRLRASALHVGVLEDLGGEKGPLQAGNGVLSEFARGVQAELG